MRSRDFPLALAFSRLEETEKTATQANGGLFFVTYWQFLLQDRLSDSIEQYNEPPRSRLHRNFAKSIFVVQIYQTDARYGGSRPTNLAERH